MTTPYSDDADEDTDTGEFGYFEVRQRDPHWLTEANAKDLRGTYERAECCWDRAAWIVELPRARKVGSKLVDVPPARFRLCHHHMQVTLSTDTEASAFPLGCRP